MSGRVGGSDVDVARAKTERTQADEAISMSWEFSWCADRGLRVGSRDVRRLMPGRRWQPRRSGPMRETKRIQQMEGSQCVRLFRGAQSHASRAGSIGGPGCAGGDKQQRRGGLRKKRKTNPNTQSVFNGLGFSGAQGIYLGGGLWRRSEAEAQAGRAAVVTKLSLPWTVWNCANGCMLFSSEAEAPSAMFAQSRAGGSR
jgi:hypothetical protein